MAIYNSQYSTNLIYKSLKPLLLSVTFACTKLTAHSTSHCQQVLEVRIMTFLRVLKNIFIIGMLLNKHGGNKMQFYFKLAIWVTKIAIHLNLAYRSNLVLNRKSCSLSFSILAMMHLVSDSLVLRRPFVLMQNSLPFLEVEY